MTRVWAKQRERGNVFVLHIISWIARYLGRSTALAFIYPITLYFYLTSAATRHASYDFLSKVLSRPPSWLDVFRHHRYFAITILDRVYLLLGRHSLFDIETNNADDILGRIEQGQGCLLLGSHLGSFEALRAIGVHQYHQTFRLHILMDEKQNQSITRFLNVMAPEIAKTVIPVGQADTMLRIKECLDQGDIVALLADRVTDDDRRTRCTFMGESADFPRGPAILSLALKVPVFSCFGLYQGGNKYQINFELLSDALNVKRADREQATEDFVCHYAKTLEKYARGAPYNWFNFYDFWHQS